MTKGFKPFVSVVYWSWVSAIWHALITVSIIIPMKHVTSRCNKKAKPWQQYHSKVRGQYQDTLVQWSKCRDVSGHLAIGKVASLNPGNCNCNISCFSKSCPVGRIHSVPSGATPNWTEPRFDISSPVGRILSVPSRATPKSSPVGPCPPKPISTEPWFGQMQ